MTLVRHLAAALLLGACMCGTQEPGAPALHALEPGEVVAGWEGTLRVSGARLQPRVRADFDAPERSSADLAFRVQLLGAGAPRELAPVRWVSESALEVAAPAGLVPGEYALRVVDPRGRAATLERALVVWPGCLEDTQCSAPPGLCHAPAGLCEAGRCRYPPRPPGASCTDGDACTRDDACSPLGACQGTFDPTLPGCGAAPNAEAPRACLTLDRTSGALGDPFLLDMGCSSDRESAPGALRARFSTDGGATWSAFLPAGTTTFQARFATPGVHTVVVEVEDGGTPQLSATAERRVAVVASSACSASGPFWEVTSLSTDEDDSARPGFDLCANPMGTGRSLREVLDHVNGRQLAGQVIAFAADGMVLRGRELPDVVAPDLTLIGRPGVTLDFANAGGGAPCVSLEGSGGKVIGLTVHSCDGHAVQVEGDRNQVAECRLWRGTRTGAPPKVAPLPGGSALFGPANEVWGFTTEGLQVKSSGVTVSRNWFHDNATGLVVQNSTHGTLERNVISRSANTGIEIANSSTNEVVVHNTIHDSGINGLYSNGGSVVLRNNLFSASVASDVFGHARDFAEHEPNGFDSPVNTFSHGNAGPDSVTADPRYVNASASDFRLQATSPMRDQGAPLDALQPDVNGPAAPGSFNGTAPDLGAHERPF